jgi:MoaA/NifB/PqqE/SkfB family radical SAM enzyme
MSADAIFKGYWLVTNRCNLDCGYCVLEDAPDQLRRELRLEEKKAFVTHLYERLRFRRLTLSGGEVLMIGKKPPADFIGLLRHLRQFRTTDPRENLELEVYTNAVLLDDSVADEMAGTVDRVAITIDSAQDELLTLIGRNTMRHRRYFDRAASTVARLARRGIEVKLHSVVGVLNHTMLPAEVSRILDTIEAHGGHITGWKFYQYMSYDDPPRDVANAISVEAFRHAAARIERALAGRLPLHFKDNAEMNASLFNILSYGNAQYMRPGDTWTSSVRTRDLRSYASMTELFAAHDIDQAVFRRFHEVQR